MVSSHNQGACAFKHCPVGTVGPTMCQETSLTTLHQQQQPELFVQSRIDPSFYFVLQFWPYHPIVVTEIIRAGNILRSSTVQLGVSWCKFYPQFPVPCWHFAGVAPAVAHLLQGLMFLCSGMLFSVSWLYFRLSIISNQSDHPPLTSAVTEILPGPSFPFFKHTDVQFELDHVYMPLSGCHVINYIFALTISWTV